MSSRNTLDLRGRRPAPKGRAASAHAVPPRFAREKPSQLRAKRRRNKALAAVATFGLIALIIFQLSYISYFPRYMVHGFSVEGTQTMPATVIEDFVTSYLHPSEHTFFSRHNILSFDEDALAQTIVESFPRVRAAEVTRESMFASAITVVVHEREEFALWCPVAHTEIAQCYGMDADGFIFARADAVPHEATSTRKHVFTGGVVASTTPMGASFAPGHFPGILAFFDGLERAGLTPVAAHVDENGTDFSITVAEGFDIKASFGQDARMLAENLQLILRSEDLRDKEEDIGYIDLRFGDKAYYKLKGEQ